MRLSRLLFAAVVSVRAVLIYGEAASATAAELTWRDVAPARRRLRSPARRYA
jgi:hypothetical protein